MKQKAIIVTSKGTRVVEVDYTPSEPTKEEIIASYQAEIEQHKAQIAESDYKVIKCAEAKLLDTVLPYDIIALHDNRQVLRDKINDLEKKIELLYNS